VVLIPSEHILLVPEHAKNQDLHDLKAFLSAEDPGLVSIKLNIKGQIVDTKLKVVTMKNVEEWAKGRWE